MAIVVPRFNLLFLMAPGTACSVVGKALIEQLDGVWLPATDIFDGTRLKLNRKHHDLAALYEARLLTSDQRRGLTVFVTVRNPYDRLVTTWQRLASNRHDESLAIRERNVQKLRQTGMDKSDIARRMTALKKKQVVATRRSHIARLAGFNLWARYAVWRFEREDARSDRPDEARRRRLFPYIDGVDYVIRYEALQAGLSEVLRHTGCGRTFTLPRRNVTPGKKSLSDLLERIDCAIFRRAVRSASPGIRAWSRRIGGGVSAMHCHARSSQPVMAVAEMKFNSHLAFAVPCVSYT